jgi:hypothetical protein
MEDENAVATECAISSLGKMIYFQRGGSPDLLSNEVVLKFLSLLPLKSEPDEAQATHKQFFEQIIAKNPQIFGSSGENLVPVKEAIDRIYKTHKEEPDLEIITEDDHGELIKNCINLLA